MVLARGIAVGGMGKAGAGDVAVVDASRNSRTGRSAAEKHVRIAVDGWSVQGVAALVVLVCRSRR